MVWEPDPDRLSKVGRGSPRYELIAEMIREAITDGRLPIGTQLPPVRQLAKDLGIGFTTAVAAYNRLREDHWINSHVGRGTFVARSITEPDGSGIETILSDDFVDRPQSTRRQKTFVPWRRRALVVCHE